MPLRLLLIITTLFLSSTVSSQRLLEYIQDIEDPGIQSLSFSNKVLYFRSGDTYLDAFGDEDGVIRRYFPMISGARLTFSYNRSPAIYNSQAWFVLSNAAGEMFLYRFNGVTFTRLIVPGSVVSNPIVFGANLYILSNTGSTSQLYRYNGTTVTAVTGGTVSGGFKLMVAGSYLYLIGGSVKRYNGTSFTNLPSFDASDIKNIHAAGSTAYIKISYYKVLYYNGTSITSVFDMPGYALDEVMWRGDLYFIPTSSSELMVIPLKRVRAGVTTNITMPAGFMPHHSTKIAVYNDALYFVVSNSTFDNKVIRYNGSFSDIFIIPGHYRQGGTIFTREDDLIIQPAIVNSGDAYEYNGSTFETLRTPDEKLFAGFLGSTTCNHIWSSLYYDFEDEHDPHRWAILKEPKGCPPPPAAAVLVIPDVFLAKWERFDLNVWGQDRGWCWNEIIIDWGIEPCTPPDCPDPIFQFNVFDKNKELVFDKMIGKPSVLDIPLNDDQRYSALMKSGTGDKHDLFVFADNLVEKGIESIGLKMKPKDGYFNICATTDKGVQVDLRVELLSKNGEVLWSKDFLAPFSKDITDKVNEPGATLRFSIPGIQKKSIITQLNTYPNPSRGQLYVQVKSDEVAQAVLSVTTLLGQKILDRKITTPFNQQLNFGNIKPGMYVVKIVSGRETVSKVIRIE